MSQRESMQYDVVIIGAGPAGLAAAIKFKQLCQQHNQEYSICVLEKGSEVGAHILSGNVFETKALDELIPDWQKLEAPIKTQVTEDNFLLLTDKKHFKLPTPPQMHNKNNYVISLGNLCRWLAEQAQNMGVDIFPGFAAKEVLYDENGVVKGVITGDFGIKKDGTQGENFQLGIEIHAKQTLIAEGCRGSLAKQLMKKFNLNQDASPQTYGLGIKELWRIKPENYQAGKVTHTIGWPLDNKTYGGSFIYHLDDNQVYVGFVVGLDYQNPYLSPYEEFQRFKTHPSIKPLFEGGERISYGARALNEGGLQAIPKLSFAGGLIIGDSAGFLNVPKIKGSHTAMKSGMLAAETVFNALNQHKEHQELIEYNEVIKNSWIWRELYQARNIRPAFHKGLWPGLIYSVFDTYIFHGRAPWTFKHHADHKSLKPAKDCQKIIYPKPDGKITFDRLSSVYLSNTNHEENQPCHLQLIDPRKSININYKTYAGPEQFYCPAGVYEYLEQDGKPYLQINAQNCVHCKTCDIKDPTQNINWVPPEGGGGPNYPNM